MKSQTTLWVHLNSPRAQTIPTSSLMAVASDWRSQRAVIQLRTGVTLMCPRQCRKYVSSSGTQTTHLETKIRIWSTGEKSSKNPGSTTKNWKTAAPRSFWTSSTRLLLSLSRRKLISIICLTTIRSTAANTWISKLLRIRTWFKSWITIS